jgi:hypothetical protein
MQQFSYNSQYDATKLRRLLDQLKSRPIRPSSHHHYARQAAAVRVQLAAEAAVRIVNIICIGKRAYRPERDTPSSAVDANQALQC